MKNTLMTAIILILSGILLNAGEGTPSGIPSGYPVEPVLFTAVKINDNFWSPKIETNRRVTIPASFRKCEETGRIDNFAIAAGMKQGVFQTKYPFDDSDVYKIMEGAAYSLAAFPDPELEKYLDSLIGKIAAAQEKDGYLMTWRTIDPNSPPTDWSGSSRWADTRNGHELYNAGHMYEAAVAHYQTTGKRSFLDVALKNADLIVDTFGPGKLEFPPGHEEIEIGLVKLYRVTGKKEYLDLAEFFINQRGNAESHELYGEAYQDHIPVLEQNEAFGHAVRAAYLYSGMADVASLTGNREYLAVIDRIWKNVTDKKLYVTGGIGSTRRDEAFGENYQLPNDSAYNETCAAIANIFWNHRMFLLKGDAAYIDVLERTLYNNMLAGVSLKGDTFFYPNVLEFDGKDTFNQGASCRSEWFNCSCCPSNVSRFIPSLPGYIYGTKQDSVYINLYIGNEADIPLPANRVRIRQSTTYPWSGSVRINVDPVRAADFSIRLRIPGWALNQPVPGDLYSFINPSEKTYTVSVNGENKEAALEHGYFTISREWRSGDTIDLNLPMPVYLLQASDKVEADAGKIALQRGPVVFCAEGVDNNGSLSGLSVSANPSFSEKFEPGTLQGTLFLHLNPGDNQIVFLPYYAWANRQVGEMKVWFPVQQNQETGVMPASLSP